MSVVLNSHIPQLIAAIEAAANELVLESATAVAHGVVDAMDEGKSGVHYPGQPNVSSAPGEAPATQSGDYAAGVKAEPDGDKKAVAYAAAVQAPRLEFGDAKVAARPNWTVEAVKEADKAGDRCTEKMRQAAESVAL